MPAPAYRSLSFLALAFQNHRTSTRTINHTAHLHKHLSLYSSRIFRILLAVKLLSRIIKQNDFLRRPSRSSPDASRMHGLLSRHAPERKLLQPHPHLLIQSLTLACVKRNSRAKAAPTANTSSNSAATTTRSKNAHPKSSRASYPSSTNDKAGSLAGSD